MSKAARDKTGREEEISSIGLQLKAWRLENHHTQDDIAVRLNKSQSMVVLVELGKRRPDLDMVVSIAKMIGIDPRKAVIQHMREDRNSMAAADVLSRRARGTDGDDHDQLSPFEKLFNRLDNKERRVVMDVLELLARPRVSLAPMR